jgi:hypothetical protein
MRLNALLLADAVSAPPDGKFYIHGGGLTRLAVPALPFPIPQLGVFVRLEIEEGEIGQTHEFKFELTDPDGDPVGPIQPPRFRAQLPSPPPDAPKPEEGEQRFVVLAINISGLSVGRKGLHNFSFCIDGDVLGSVPLPVTLLSPEQLHGGQASPVVELPPAMSRAQRRQPPARRRPPRQSA